MSVWKEVDPAPLQTTGENTEYPANEDDVESGRQILEKLMLDIKRRKESYGTMNRISDVIAEKPNAGQVSLYEPKPLYSYPKAELAAFPSTPSTPITLDLASIPAEYKEAALAIAPAFMKSIWTAMVAEMQKNVLPTLNNTAEWVNHTSVDTDDIMSSYKQHYITSQDETKSTSNQVLTNNNDESLVQIMF